MFSDFSPLNKSSHRVKNKFTKKHLIVHCTFINNEKPERTIDLSLFQQ